jgi:hypothetical protein
MKKKKNKLPNPVAKSKVTGEHGPTASTKIHNSKKAYKRSDGKNIIKYLYD